MTLRDAVVSRWRVAIALAVLLGAVACKESDDGGSTSNSAEATTSQTECEAYCAAVQSAGCSGAVSGDCAATCSAGLEAVGSCLESWRAMTRCMTESGLTCTDAGVVPADACLEPARQHRDCLQAQAGTGGN